MLRQSHPISFIIFMIAMISGSIYINNQIYLIISLISSVVMLHSVSSEQKNVFKELRMTALVFVAISVANPIFNHRGKTVLLFINGLPITKEAIVNGVILSLSIVSVFLWFKVFSAVMTADKIMYLVGGFSPSIAVLISMTVRFIPDFKMQWNTVKSNSVVNSVFDDSTFLNKVNSYCIIFSAFITLCLENGLQTADSMRARGFELGGRTRYSPYKFRIEDLIIIILSVFSAFVLAFWGKNVNIKFYPEIRIPRINIYLMLICAAHIITVFFTVIFYFIITRKRKRVCHEFT